MDEFGITMSVIPPTETDFYPRSAVRRVSVSTNQGARQQQQQQNSPYDIPPAFPQTRM